MATTTAPPTVPVRRRAEEVRVATDTFELRAVDDDGVYLEGVAAPYMQWVDVGSYDERFAPQVFETTLNRNPDRVPLCVNHKISDIAVGRPVQWDDSSEALRGVWRFDSRAEAQEVARMAREGILTGLSVHFQPGRKKSDNTVERTDEGRARVTRRKARLIEVSLVTVPAIEDAAVTVVRTKGISDLEQQLVDAGRGDELRAEMASLRARLAQIGEPR